jgi:hypothetical protein
MVFTGCGNAADGAPGDTTLSGYVSEAGARYALASGKPVVFAGATVTRDGKSTGGAISAPLIINRAVTLIANSPALTVVGAVIITAEPAAGSTGTITADILIGDDAITDKWGTSGAGTRLKPAATGIGVKYTDIDDELDDVVVIGNLTLEEDDEVELDSLYVTGNLLVEGKITVTGAAFVGGLVTVAKDAEVASTGEPPTGTLLLQEGAKLTIGGKKIVGDSNDASYSVDENSELQVTQVSDGGTAYTVKKGTVTINKNESYIAADVLIVDKGATATLPTGVTLTVNGTVNVAGTLDINPAAKLKLEATSVLTIAGTLNITSESTVAQANFEIVSGATITLAATASVDTTGWNVSGTGAGTFYTTALAGAAAGARLKVRESTLQTLATGSIQAAWRPCPQDAASVEAGNLDHNAGLPIVIQKGNGGAYSNGVSILTTASSTASGWYAKLNEWKQVGA